MKKLLTLLLILIPALVVSQEVSPELKKLIRVYFQDILLDPASYAPLKYEYTGEIKTKAKTIEEQSAEYMKQFNEHRNKIKQYKTKCADSTVFFIERDYACKELKSLEENGYTFNPDLTENRDVVIIRHTFKATNKMGLLAPSVWDMYYDKITKIMVHKEIQ